MSPAASGTGYFELRETSSYSTEGTWSKGPRSPLSLKQRIHSRVAIRHLLSSARAHPLGREAPGHEIARSLLRFHPRDRRAPVSAPDRALQAHFRHDAGHRAAGDPDDLPVQLTPGFAEAIELKVVGPNPRTSSRRHASGFARADR